MFRRKKYSNRAVMQRRYLDGEVTASEKMDAYYQSYGFKNTSDFNAQVRLTVLKIIALHSEHEYPFTEKSNGIAKQIEIINKYKNIITEFKCHCCEILFDYHFIAIDHIDNNGAEHRRDRSTLDLSSHILRHGFNPKYRLVLMCHDCNHELGHYSYCHHHPELKREIKSGKITTNESIKTDKTDEIMELFA